MSKNFIKMTVHFVEKVKQCFGKSPLHETLKKLEDIVNNMQGSIEIKVLYGAGEYKHAAEYEEF